MIQAGSRVDVEFGHHTSRRHFRWFLSRRRLGHRSRRRGSRALSLQVEACSRGWRWYGGPAQEGDSIPIGFNMNGLCNDLLSSQMEGRSGGRIGSSAISLLSHADLADRILSLVSSSSSIPAFTLTTHDSTTALLSLAISQSTFQSRLLYACALCSHPGGSHAGSGARNNNSTHGVGA